MFIATLKQAKRLVVALVGVTIVGIGIAMIVLPGPAIIVIPIGLGVLATEFVWAKKLLHDLKARFPGRNNNGAGTSAGTTPKATCCDSAPAHPHHSPSPPEGEGDDKPGNGAPL